MPKIYGLLRIRNESLIIKNTLDHMTMFCDGVFIYDDCSTDNTVEICKNHPLTIDIHSADTWSADRYVEEFRNRQFVLDMARNNPIVKESDYFVYQDADEYLELDMVKLNSLIDSGVDAIKMNLWDFYITPQDVDKNYLCREYIGVEYREILFFFRNHKDLKYHVLDQRECTLPRNYKTVVYGDVRHYGKGISIDQWEETCDYYINNFPKYAEKWKKRKGKAIHTVSDFGTKLIKWSERNLNVGVRI